MHEIINIFVFGTVMLFGLGSGFILVVKLMEIARKRRQRMPYWLEDKQ